MEIIPDTGYQIHSDFCRFYVLWTFFCQQITKRRQPNPTPTLVITPTPTLVQARARPERGIAARFGRSEKCADHRKHVLIWSVLLVKMAVKAPEEVGLNGQLYVNTETSYTHTYVCP